MYDQSTYTDYKFDLVTVSNRVYAPFNFEHVFEIHESEQTYGTQNRAETIPPLLSAVPSQEAGHPVTREDVLAVKTAQLAAQHLSIEARDSMAFHGPEFATDTFVRDASRLMANLTAPSLQPLKSNRRLSVVARATDPEATAEDLDLILDGVSRVLRTYCRYLPTMRWTSIDALATRDRNIPVLGWRDADGAVVLDLLDTFGPERSPAQHRAEIAEVLATAADAFADDLVAVRFLPTFSMRQARLYYPDGGWLPYTSQPTVPLRRATPPHTEAA